eukprot:3756665-Karenia_brevis.AAC.1
MPVNLKKEFPQEVNALMAMLCGRFDEKEDSDEKMLQGDMMQVYEIVKDLISNDRERIPRAKNLIVGASMFTLRSA